MESNKSVLDWDKAERDLEDLLDKNGKLSSRKINTRKGEKFRESYPVFDPYSFSRIYYIIKSRTFETRKCKHCGGEASFDEYLKDFKDHCFECRYKDREAWNKGLTKEDSESLRRIGEAVSRKKKGRPLTEKERAVIDNNAEVNKNRVYSKEQFEKAAQTTFERHGVRSYLQIVQPKGLEAQREKYGDKLYAGSEERKKHITEELEKRKQTSLERYGYEHPIQHPEIKAKQRESLLSNGNMYFGSEKHRQDLHLILEKSRQTMRNRYGYENPSQVPEMQQKRVNSLDENGTWFFHSKEYDERFEEFLEKKRETSLKNFGVDHHMRAKEVKEKIRQTNLEKWGTKYYFQSDYYRNEIFPLIVKDAVKKANKTKKENGTFNTSQPERESIRRLKKKFQYVFSQYSDDRYPFKSDAYLPELDLFIEFNYHWTHGEAPYSNSKEDQELLAKWEEKAKSSDFYEAAIDVWTGADVIKRNIGSELNWIEFFDEEEFDKWISLFPDSEFVIPEINLDSWEIPPSTDLFNKMIKSKASYKMTSTNKFKDLVIPFVFDFFYKKEKEKLQDSKTVKKLLQNRYQYLNKTDLTQKEIFDGLSKAGIQRGYSTFSPLIAKAFIRNFKVSSIYDPFGGWGSRMLGAWDIRYHYNDANPLLVEKIKEMHEFYSQVHEGGKKTFSTNDAASYTPDEYFDAVFTCPPYFDVEDYNFEKDSSKIFPNYEEWLDIWWRKVIQNSKKVAPIFAYVVSSDFVEDMNRVLIEEGYGLIDTKQTTVKKKNHLSSSKEEFLHIFKLLT